MRRTLIVRAVALALAVLLVGCAGTPKQPPIERLVVFGDSNVDTGNLFRMTSDRFPAPPDWRGRNSNGPNVIDYLAKGLGVKVQNYAVSGATSGLTNVIGLFPGGKPLEITGVRWQIDQFIEKDGGKLAPSDLVILWAGSNDLFRIDRKDAAALTKAIAGVSANINAETDRLYRLGARRILVANRTPRYVLENEDNLNGIDLNKAVAVAVADSAKRTGADVRLVDAYAVVVDIMNSPTRYGFVQVNAICTQAPACVAEKYDESLKIANGYVQWDPAGHKTTRVHALMAEKILGMVKP